MYFGTKDGLIITENDQTVDKIGDLMHADPDNILPQHRYMLILDLEELGEGPVANKQG